MIARLWRGQGRRDHARELLQVEIEADGLETLGGYVLARVGRVPSVGETFDFDGLHAEVLEEERRRIHRVRFRRLSAQASAAQT